MNDDIWKEDKGTPGRTWVVATTLVRSLRDRHSDVQQD
jgi:hypothetical protein